MIVAAGHVLIREATEDTVLTIPNPVGEEGSKTIPIPKGTEVHFLRRPFSPALTFLCLQQIMVDMVGVRA
jgi:hypothetical protein